MVPSKEYIDELYREEVRDARAMDPWNKFLAGAELFDLACSFTMAGIRHQHPEADEEMVRHILEQRLEMARRLEIWNDQ